MKRSFLEVKIHSEIVQILSQQLADTYLLYTKTQNFHWNIVDPRFYQLHKIFEEQYEELAKAIDIIAERIRMLGGRAPGTMHEFLNLGSIEESTDILTGNQMIKQLAEDHTFLADSMRLGIVASSKLGDEGTTDMMINRLRSHEKNMWMLQSHLSHD